jgi:hypothetical protein
MRNRHILPWSVVVAAGLIPVTVLLGEQRSAGCPANYPCDPRSFIPGWVLPVLVGLCLWVVVVGVPIGLAAVKRWGQSHPSATQTSRLLRWSAVGAVAAMPVVLWLGRARQPSCKVPAIGQCDAGFMGTPSWASRAFLGLLLWLVLSLVLAVALDQGQRESENA